MSLRVETFSGADITSVVPDLARLRIAVFRDWPYLYDGDLDYERGYLADYATGNGMVCAVYDGDTMVGAATGMPLAEHGDAAQLSGDYDVSDVFYCAESVLLPAYRGRGLGHVFFDRREAFARTLRLTRAAFCAVQRPADHPLRPADYRPLDPFWRKRGYAPVPGMVARFTWQDVDQPQETPKKLQFWMRAL